MPSKLGIHGILPGETFQIMRQLETAGARMATVKAVADVGWLREVKTADPEVKTMGRFLEGVSHDVDVEGPQLYGDIAKSARQVMDSILPKWEPHRSYVDYWEIINEQDPPGVDGHLRLTEFMLYCIEIAEREGYKLALFSYSMGVPEWEEMEAITSTGIFGKAKAGGHVLSLHEYAYPMKKWYGEPLPGRPTYADRGPLACRYRWWYEDFLIPRNEVVPLYITEANLNWSMPSVTAQEWIDGIAWYDSELRKDYYVVGAHLFTLGSAGSWPQFDFARFLPEMIAHMVSIKQTVDPVWPKPPEGPGPQPTPPAPPPPVQPGGDPPTSPPTGPCNPRLPYGRHYLLLPPGTDWRWIGACERYWETFKVTVGGSADDAGYGPGLTQRAVTAVNPDWWPSNLRTFFDDHYPGVTYDPIFADSPQTLEDILNQRALKHQRFG
ncbi:MAG: hypothetical protein E4H27_10750 [Anaerolineales bacterium]|nr:MAG: hypothetical protein E4H27_10750 [Anaerolineales bacterium]